MPDLSTELIAWERPGHDPVIDETDPGPGASTRSPGSTPCPGPGRSKRPPSATANPPPPWCPLRRTAHAAHPAPAAEAYAAEGNPVGARFVAGWEAFDRQAPAAARDVIDRLGVNPAPLVAPWTSCRAVGLHGDLKLANVALLPTDQVGFIDWQMTMRAPVAVELGWFLVSNSGSLPAPPDGSWRPTAQELDWNSGRWGFDSDAHDFAGLAGDWDVQRDLAWIVGLLLRGWRKGLDAEAGRAAGLRACRRGTTSRGGASGSSRPPSAGSERPHGRGRVSHTPRRRRRPCPRPSRTCPASSRGRTRSARSSRPTASCSSPARSAMRRAAHGAVPGGIEAETRAMLDNVGRLLDGRRPRLRGRREVPRSTCATSTTSRR